MSAQEVLGAVLVVCTEQTTPGTGANIVARAEVDIPNDLNLGDLPACVVTCPRTIERRGSTSQNRETHTILVEYLDAPESTASQQMGIQAARAWLEQAKHNLRVNRRLETPTGTPHGLMQLEFRTDIAEPFNDKDSGRILIHGQFEVDVLGSMVNLQ